MERNETLSEEEFLQEVTSSFFGWIWDDFLPILMMVLFLILFVFGILLNIILLVVAWRNGWHKEPVHAFILQLCIVDLLACALIILPTLVALQRDGPAFPDSAEACNFQHFTFTLCLMLTFLFILIGVIERTVRVISPRLYVKCFGNGCFVILLVAAMWLIGCVISFLSLVDQELDYDADLYYCFIRFDKNPLLLNFLFVICYHLPISVIVVCFILIFCHRNRDVKERISTKLQVENDYRDSGLESEVSFAKERATSVFYINKRNHHEKPPSSSLSMSNARVGFTLARDEIDAGNISKTHRRQLMSHLNAKKKWKSVVKRVKERNRIAQVFRDKPDDINHHQAMTYLLTWITLTICWLVYIITQYLNVYSNRCGTCLSVGVLIGQSTYSWKPLFYIAHNRWYRSTCLGTIKMRCKKESVNDTIV